MRFSLDIFFEISYLNSKLGLSPTDLGRIALKYPQIFSLSITTNLDPKFSLFQKTLGYNKKELRTLFVTTPTTLSLSLSKNLEPKIDYLLHEAKLSKQLVRSFILQVG